MNDVSWRRILEQVDSRQPASRNPDAVRPSARAHFPEHPPQQNVDWSNLEAELTHATHDSDRATANSKARPIRRRQPSPGQHATQLKMRMEHAAAYDAPPSYPQQAKSRKPSGARNLIAISLSLAVVGFAAYQLRERMPQNGVDDEVSTAQHSTSAFINSNSQENAQQGNRVRGNRIDLRPSLASQADWSTERLASAEATDTTSSINTANVAAVLPQQADGTLDGTESETLVLDRGRNILERGHVSGARLIFEYLADRGSPLGAFALAQTYDAKYISKHNLPSDAADASLASKWYQHAADLTNAAKTKTQ
ncbi:MAG TPA: hypothetical protein VKA94_07125 [Hyphomicrobiales bacterium]|nr:hypothetical protein [Hyphomicrobiales bacterium]